MKKCIKPFFAILIASILLSNATIQVFFGENPPLPPLPPCPIYTFGGRLVDDGCEGEYCEF